MNKLRLLVLFPVLFFSMISISQSVRQPEGGGATTDQVKIKDEISQDQRVAIAAMLQANETRLRNEGKLQPFCHPNGHKPISVLPHVKRYRSSLR